MGLQLAVLALAQEVQILEQTELFEFVARGALLTVLGIGHHGPFVVGRQAGGKATVDLRDVFRLPTQDGQIGAIVGQLRVALEAESIHRRAEDGHRFIPRPCIDGDAIDD